MNNGAWHQFGWHSQKMIIEELDNQAGVGVIMSPRDLALGSASNYASQYAERGAALLYDPQWHVPQFTNRELSSYPTNAIRGSVASLGEISPQELHQLVGSLVSENDSFETGAIIAPAIVYEAGRNDIIELNSQLHQAALNASQQSGKPLYATVVLGQSVTSSHSITDHILSTVTGLQCDGWYFAYEFPEERIPSNTTAVYNCLRSILTLAATGLPILHAYAGPMGILSFSAGATGAAIGPSQKQWRFCRERWENSEGGGGGNGNAPERYFSRALWGTIVVPDETILLGSNLRSEVMAPSPFAQIPIPAQWSRGDSQRHTVYTVCKAIEEISSGASHEDRRLRAIAILDSAIELHSQISGAHIDLKDNTSSYQANWKASLEILHQNHGEDFEYLDLI